MKVALIGMTLKVFHVIGPAYLDAFSMLEVEIEKCRRLGRTDTAVWYDAYRDAPAARG